MFVCSCFYKIDGEMLFSSNNKGQFSIFNLADSLSTKPILNFDICEHPIRNIS